MSSETQEEESLAIVKMYDQAQGDLTQIAATTGVSLDLLTKNPPSDAQDFAQQYLKGAYSGEMQFLSDLYSRNQGNLEELSKLTGCSLPKMRESPPEDSKDFANKMLDDTYWQDQDAKRSALQRMQWEMQNQSNTKGADKSSGALSKAKHIFEALGISEDSALDIEDIKKGLRLGLFGVMGFQ